MYNLYLFDLKKKLCFVLKMFRFLMNPQTSKFVTSSKTLGVRNNSLELQCILEVTLLIVFLESLSLIRYECHSRQAFSTRFSPIV